jgi:hypothetical protein
VAEAAGAMEVPLKTRGYNQTLTPDLQKARQLRERLRVAHLFNSGRAQRLEPEDLIYWRWHCLVHQVPLISSLPDFTFRSSWHQVYVLNLTCLRVSTPHWGLSQ